MVLFCFIIPVLQSNRGKVIWRSKGCSCRRVFDVRLNLVDDWGSHLLWHLLFSGKRKEKKKRAFVATRMVIMMEVGVITDESHPKSRLIILSLLGVSQSEAGATCQIHRRKVGVGVLNDFELMLLALVTNRREKERRKEKTDNNIKPK